MMNKNKILKRCFPVCLALMPIGVLFGILAGQHGFNFLAVLLFSALGFTGSGQFIFLGYYQDDFLSVGYITAFIIILSMNIRYIPMTLVNTPQAENHQKLILYAHLLSDESFAIEKIEDDYQTHFKIRIYVFSTWVVSTLIGQTLSYLIPKNIIYLLNISFPISSTLLTLSLLNIRSSFSNDKKYLFILLFLLNIALIKLINPSLFWIPAITLNYLILKLRT